MIKKILFISVLLTLMLSRTNGQVYYTKNGSASFFSKASLQDIEANNNQVVSVLDIKTGSIQFSILNNAFHFPKAKMEEDFNEDYMESAKYPRSTFKGTVKDIDRVMLGRDGSYAVTVNGTIMIHGVSKNITTPATIIIKNGRLSALATFNVMLQEFKIHIPTIVVDKIAEKIQVKINCNYEKK